MPKSTTGEGVAILLLALVHAELGAMWPVASGTARFPHYAFGGAAGASFGIIFAYLGFEHADQLARWSCPRRLSPPTEIGGFWVAMR